MATYASSHDEKRTSEDNVGIESQITVDGQVYKQSRGVERIENLAKAAKNDGKLLYWIIGASMIVCATAAALESGTVYAYQIFATSAFQEHSTGIAGVGIATSIISAISQPFIAKIADIWSRPSTYVLVLAFYVVGFALSAACKNIASYIVGQSVRAVGDTGLTLLQTILVADLVPLQWRGMALGALATPYLFTVWCAGVIIEAMNTANRWRWGYGMWCIIMTVILTPAIAVLFYFERRAKKTGIVNDISSSGIARQKALENSLDGKGHSVAMTGTNVSIWTHIKLALIEIDAFGLILLGFGFALLLLPFSLAGYAKGGWSNRSLIAMVVVGFVCLCLYGLYESKIAPVPSCPRRLLKNKTFLTAILINFIYMVAGYLHLAFFSSYIIVTDLGDRDWSYVGNALTMGLCSGGLLAGYIMRKTHRYKLLQVIGLGVKIIGMGLLVGSAQNLTSVANFVILQLVIGLGGSFSVVGSQIASQASVPHQDVALAISLLNLWTSIGAAVGYAISGVVWQALMPNYLAAGMAPLGVDAETIAGYYGNILGLKALPFSDPVRQAGIEAYKKVMYKLWAAALGTSFVPFIAAFFQTNYYLGDQQNGITNTTIAGEKVEVVEHPRYTHNPSTLKEKLWNIWAH